MTGNPLFRETIRAASLGNADEASRLYDQIPKSDLNEYHMFVVAFFAAALGVRFQEDQSLSEIKRFADEMRYDYRDAQPPVKQLVVEGLIRGMLGEEQMFDEISPQEQYRTQLLAIRKIVGQSPEMQARMDDYLTDAETLATQWQSGE
ncbi:hypothetical protein L0U85_02060 [Glycomyces sp. L485]|uniref:hypothetical protein n=1 Tax=Glycomyces sp. L485 TaxID=2909235 RepID=UPI001F4AAD84|nr:hypothetical protein [Glycomyces sp. L485]MCH7229651.1 hypothetical protein [Glycomyces sp. L485]